MADTSKMVVLQLNAQALRDLLQLPADAEVVRVEMEPGCRGNVNLVIAGAGWDTAEGEAIHSTRGSVRTAVNEQGALVRYQLDWGFNEVAQAQPAEAPAPAVSPDPEPTPAEAPAPAAPGV